MPAASSESLSLRVRGVGATHQGMVRRHNEDNLLLRPDAGLWMVADGVGGAHAGDWASAQIVEALREMPAPSTAPELLAGAVARLEESNQRMVSRAAERGSGMTASTVVLLLTHGVHYTCLWAGDSRCYLLREGVMTQITHDHSEVQELIDAGALSPEEAERYPRANVITRALGVGPRVQLDRVAGRLQPGDRFLLCTDGLSRMISDAEIAALLTESDIASVPSSLIAAALSAGGHDNVTVMVVTCEAAPQSDSVATAAPGAPWAAGAGDVR
ncbi:MAG: serine/threonine-protein phosphatase [Alphaproteobacteria bacterium]|nr:serine/threonine-protein phosphatase [Alphaproteobacteria bacterium]